MKAKPKTHRVTMTVTEYRAWLDYKACSTSSRRNVRMVAKALRTAEARFLPYGGWDAVERRRRAAERKAAQANP